MLRDRHREASHGLYLLDRTPPLSTFLFQSLSRKWGWREELVLLGAWYLHPCLVSPLGLRSHRICFWKMPGRSVN